MTKSVFIDGEHGTTGLQIAERLAGRTDINLLSLAMEERRDNEKRTAMLRDADIAILCLPDDAAREAVALAEGSGTRFIDASTAHRVADGWVYGFAESEPGQREKIIHAQNVSNPGCYSTGAIALLRPLTLAGLLPDDYPVTINAVSGYTGGGKQMIAQMEDAAREDAIASPYFAYALTLKHKHVPEIKARSGLKLDPILTPNVGRFAQGMLVNIPLHTQAMNGATRETIYNAFASHYAGQDIVEVVANDATDALVRIDPTEMAGTDRMKLYVCARDDGSQINLVASLDNLGKGASGAAVQNLDLMLMV
ncbi:N-acetyl-gamma-glutamyl-phosphate reductase [Ahrensia marina]|uniref:N-acetyl-gamma-glutamyl-phosphate reductase n=1 Tax=Ahrensia marina TaxID=1514904 RepID=A0A0N0E7Z4_9HYPH|nr:N-acetyl-gamma-glutamyl-phosphate reductase [Ahrensia marina]KPB01771.1 N-acetyl-gamma-glutamyl-phosphate reductase [Ahrensia marina]